MEVIPFHLCPVPNLPYRIINSPMNAEMFNVFPSSLLFINKLNKQNKIEIQHEQFKTIPDTF